MNSISLIIPTCGRLGSIQRLLADFSAVGYCARSDLQIIVVDNNRTPSDALRTSVSSAGALYLYQPRLGQAAALNKGIGVAAGSLVAFCDDDIRVDDPLWIDRLSSHFKDPKIGYVAGNVLAHELVTKSQCLWEKKGGLSKGNLMRRFTRDVFMRFSFRGAPLRFIATGANCMMPRNVLFEIGGYDERFGVGSKVGHSQSYEICYKIIRANYDAVYEPSAVVTHHHPETLSALCDRMFRYGVGDTAVQFHFLLTYGDVRGLFEAFGARHFHLSANLIRSLLGRYPLPASAVIASLAGSTLGPMIYTYATVHAFFERTRHDQETRFS
jgi:O-antigen biosynthesis protein